ncbi:MAG: hypothetical protein ACXAEX_23155 [Promethearchaeota archaeon]
MAKIIIFGRYGIKYLKLQEIRYNGPSPRNLAGFDSDPSFEPGTARFRLTYLH